MESKVLEVIEEQISVEFTGKVNILSNMTRQFLGNILFKNGDVIQVSFQGQKALKAFYHLIIQEYTLQSFAYVIEPEVVEEKERQIHYPYSVLKNKMKDVLKQYRESIKLRPPGKVKIIAEAEFIKGNQDLTHIEYKVLETLTEWSKADDIYQHCQLMDHEITIALVSLRKKGALRIISSSNNP